MKKFLLTVASLSLFALPAVAAPSPYVGGSVGPGFFGNSDATYSGISSTDYITYQTGVPFTLGVGLKGESYRAEAAFGFQSHDVEKIKLNGIDQSKVSGYRVSLYSYMVNGYYDIDLRYDSIIPYVMAGLGVASIHSSEPTISYDRALFAWQAGAGVSVPATRNITIDLAYRYFKPSSYDAGNATDISSFSHNFLLGARYIF
ncbi:MAG: outer membrane beta-barrel protein [Chlorobiaceae bacterium]